MKLYVFPLHPNSARVLAIFYELEIEGEVIPVDIFKGETRQPEFLEINPKGTVPALKHEDLLLWESRAIMGYLAALKPEANFLPSEPDLRAQVDQWLFWDALEFFPAMDRLVTQRVINPAMGKATDEVVADSAMQDVVEKLWVVERALADRNGLAGPVTIADFDLAVLLSQSGLAGIDLSRYPEISRWLANMEARPGIQKAIAPARSAFGA